MNPRETVHCKNLILGAGPAGLAIAGRLRNRGKEFTILERDQNIASMWRRHYDRLHLHTVKQLSHLPYLPFPPEYPLYVSRQQLVDYYDMYARKFDIHPIFGVEAHNILRRGNLWHVVTNSNTYVADEVVFATGSNRIPVSPTWPGQEDFSGEILHSRLYKNPKPFENKKVFVVGMGNTGAEIALDLAESQIENYLSVRSPVNIVPRDVLGRPAQLTAKMLDKLPFGLGKLISKLSRRIIIGDLSKYGIQQPQIDPVDQLRQTGQTPVIDLGTVRKIKEGKIKIVPDLEQFTTNGVILKNGELLEIDAIILATGYRSGIDHLIKNTGTLTDQYGLPKFCIGQDEFAGLYFLGFDNYKLGGILGSIYEDSEKIAEAIGQRTKGQGVSSQ
ncbi:MAG: NAD(P)/FAD-dependent oxidoreductase [Saprospiraceae bacterium]|nr:NAD(P)/FAD-dependent oxidoreductase [Saprospiraceae bacterium]